MTVSLSDKHMQNYIVYVQHSTALKQISFVQVSALWKVAIERRRPQTMYSSSWWAPSAWAKVMEGEGKFRIPALRTFGAAHDPHNKGGDMGLLVCHHWKVSV